MYTNDDQIVTMNAISNTPSNFDFYHLILALAITASSRKYVRELVERHGHSKWRYIVIYILPIVLIIFKIIFFVFHLAMLISLLYIVNIING